MSGFFCIFVRFCFENHISFLQSYAFGFAVIIYFVEFFSPIKIAYSIRPISLKISRNRLLHSDANLNSYRVA